MNEPEVERLRARLARLEAERAQTAAAAARAVAAAQERAYWPDRLGIDFDRVFGSRAGQLALTAAGGARRARRRVQTTRARLAGALGRSGR